MTNLDKSWLERWSETIKDMSRDESDRRLAYDTLVNVMLGQITTDKLFFVTIDALIKWCEQKITDTYEPAHSVHIYEMKFRLLIIQLNAIKEAARTTIELWKDLR